MTDTFGLTNPEIQDRKKLNIIAKPVQRKRIEDDDDGPKLNQQDRERFWKLIDDRLLFTPPSKDFYDDIYDKKKGETQYLVKPGTSFWHAIIQCRKINGFRINVPETLMYHSDYFCLLYTDYDGTIKIKHNATSQEFEKKVYLAQKAVCDRFKDKIDLAEAQSTKKNYNQSYSMEQLYFKINIPPLEKRFEETSNTLYNMETPFIVIRDFESEWLSKKTVKNYMDSTEFKPDQNSSQLTQRYIISRPIKATIFRLVYFTKNSGTQKANYAFRIQNRLDIFDGSKKPFNAKCTINMNKDENLKWNARKEDEFSFEYQLVKGQGLQDYESQTEQLVKLIELNYKVRISKIVCDFIQDIEGKIWFINCKYIQQGITRTMDDYLKELTQGEELTKDSLNQLTCSIFCKLCSVKFKKDEASKVLTYKLLWELVQHLKKRNIYDKYPQLKSLKVSHNSTRPCRVCNLCYMLVVGEHELIEIEQKFAKAQNIPIHDEFIRVPMDIQPKHRPALLSETLYQWRLIFLICEVSDLSPNHKIDPANTSLQYKLSNYKTSFPLDRESFHKKKNTPSISANETINSKRLYSGVRSQQNLHVDKETGKQIQTTYRINYIRVHYFFSEESSISKFLSETEIKCRLTHGSDWNSFIAEGSSKTISHFKNRFEGGQRHSQQMLLFFEDAKYCTLTLQVGLVCDKQYNTSKMNLYKYNDIYFPDDSYHNANYFPPEWMEMFEEIEPKIPIKSLDEQDNQKSIEKYSPKCTQKELNKMIDFDSYKTKNKYINIQPKINQASTDNNPKFGSSDHLKPLSLGYDAFSYSNANNNFTNIFPSTSQNNQQKAEFGGNTTGKPPRAGTAQMKRNNSEFQLRPQSTKNLVSGNHFHSNFAGNKPSRVSTGAIIKQKQQDNLKGAESYKFLLDRKKDVDEIDIMKEYEKEFYESGDEQEEIDFLNDSGELVIREKLMQHFKKLNQMEELIDMQEIEEQKKIQSVPANDFKEFLDKKKRETSQDYNN